MCILLMYPAAVSIIASHPPGRPCPPSHNMSAASANVTFRPRLSHSPGKMSTPYLCSAFAHTTRATPHRPQRIAYCHQGGNHVLRMADDVGGKDDVR